MKRLFATLVSAGLAGAACSSPKTESQPLVEDQLTGLSLLPAQVSIPQSLTVPVTLRVVRSTGQSGPVAVTISGLPDGVSASPASFTGNTGTVNLSASPTAPVTSGASATVTATNAHNSISAPLIVNVTATGFSLSLVPNQANVSRGSSHSVAVHVSRQNFSGVIEVTVAGLPPQVTADPLSISANVGNLLFRAAPTAGDGTFPVNVTGTSGSIQVTVPFLLTVNPPGAVDDSFGPGGSDVPGLAVTHLETTDAGTTSAATGVAIDSDGKIVVVGNRQRRTTGVGTPCLSTCRAIAVARYDIRGVLDPTFVGSGTPDGGVAPPLGAIVMFEGAITTNPPSVTAVAISDGGILLASGGSTTNPDTLFRLMPDGTLDETFNFDGGRGPGRARKTINASAVAVLADEKILVAGITYPPPTQLSVALARYNSDGTLDATFGDGGILVKQLAGTTGSPSVSGAALVGDKAFLVGSASFGAPSRTGMAVVSFDLTDGGFVDTSFNDGGQVLFQLGEYSSTGQTALGLGENVVVTANTRATVNNYQDIANVNLQPDGGLDSSFGTDGIARTVFTHSSQMPNSAAVNAAAISRDKIVLAGSFLRTTNQQFLVVRYNIDGSPDTAFGTDGSGIAVNNPSANNAVFYAITFQPDGKMVAVGSVDQPTNSNQFAVVRYLP